MPNNTNTNIQMLPADYDFMNDPQWPAVPFVGMTVRHATRLEFDRDIQGYNLITGRKDKVLVARVSAAAIEAAPAPA